MKQKLIVILGPTASGKSDLAVLLAKKINSEIISADSRQIYKGLDIGTGKITKKEMRGVTHYLLNIANPKQTFTVAQYKNLAQKTIKKVWKKGKIPIICGGTGFYIKAAAEGLVIPEVKPNLKLRKKLEKIKTEKLFGLLKKQDPERAKTIDAKNPYRLIRALEIIHKIGKVPKLETKPITKQILYIGIKKEKIELKKLIEKRLLKRLGQGLIEEVKNLNRNKLSWKRLENLGLEYRYIAYYLQKKISKKEMIEKLSKEICHYAKRQMTWFNKNKNIYWTKNKKEALKLTKNFIKI